MLELAHGLLERCPLLSDEIADGHADVVEVRPAEVGVVQREDVARLHRRAGELDDRLSGEVQRPHVRGKILAALRNGVAVPVGEGRREVTGPDDERVACSQDLFRHLIDDHPEGVLQHLERDRVEHPLLLDRHAGRPSREIWRVPLLSIAAVNEGGISTVESSPSTTAGPLSS